MAAREAVSAGPVCKALSASVAHVKQGDKALESGLLFDWHSASMSANKLITWFAVGRGLLALDGRQSCQCPSALLRTQIRAGARGPVDVMEQFVMFMKVVLPSGIPGGDLRRD